MLLDAGGALLACGSLLEAVVAQVFVWELHGVAAQQPKLGLT